MGPFLIALAGPSRSGKGTCASAIQAVADARGLSMQERQFSGPGKEYIAQAFRPELSGDERACIEWWESLKNEEIGRVFVLGGTWIDGVQHGTCSIQQYMQRMLQGARERWGDSFWTDKLLPLYGELNNGTLDPKWWDSFDFFGEGIVDIAVISDLRQANEAKRVRELGGIVVDIVRPTNDDAYRTSTGHITEQRLLEGLVDYEIVNDGTLDDLVSKATIMFSTIIKQKAQDKA